MFLVRSAFWLTAAFLVVAPTVGTDIGAVASTAGGQMAASGKDMALNGLSQLDCDTLECTLGRAVAVSALEQLPSQSSINPMQDAPNVGPAPVPPPRPDWAG